MAIPYSEDFRNKVMKALEGGLSNAKTAKKFDISVSTVEQWRRKKRETGNVKVKVYVSRGSKPKVTLEEFEEYLKNNAHKNQYEMAEDLNISQNVVHKKLKQLGYTKKKDLYLRKQERREKRRMEK